MPTYEEILNFKIGGFNAQHAVIKDHLTEVAEVDLGSEPWTFDMVRVYVRKHDGMILWAHDSGCFCPAPFESTQVKDLAESTSATFIDAVLKAHPNPERGLAAVRRDLALALAEAKEAGAR